MRNRNFTPVTIRLRLQTLRPASTKCSWKRRTSSAVAVSGERFKNAANRLQLWMWLRCEWGLSLRAVMTCRDRARGPCSSTADCADRGKVADANVFEDL